MLQKTKENIQPRTKSNSWCCNFTHAQNTAYHACNSLPPLCSPNTSQSLDKLSPATAQAFLPPTSLPSSGPTDAILNKSTPESVPISHCVVVPIGPRPRLVWNKLSATTGSEQGPLPTLRAGGGTLRLGACTAPPPTASAMVEKMREREDFS